MFPWFSSSLTGSGIAVSLLGVAYFANIQHIAYFIVVQILSGIMQVLTSVVGTIYAQLQEKAPITAKKSRLYTLGHEIFCWLAIYTCVMRLCVNAKVDTFFIFIARTL